MNCGVDEDEGDGGVLALEEKEKGGLRMEMEERDDDGCRGSGFLVWDFWNSSEEREEEVKRKGNNKRVTCMARLGRK